MTPDFHSTTCTRIVNIFPFETSFVKICFSEKLFVKHGFQFHGCGTMFQSLSPAEGQVVWDGMMHCMVWYCVLGDGMMHGCGSEM